MYKLTLELNQEGLMNLSNFIANGGLNEVNDIPEVQQTKPVIEKTEDATKELSDSIETEDKAVLANAPVYTLEDLQFAATKLMDENKSDLLIPLLGEFNTSSLADLDSKLYGAFANKLREMGAEI